VTQAISAPPFAVHDLALVTMATGVRVQSLKELRDALLWVPARSIYHHFWERLLRSSFDEPEFYNDFASWTRHGLHEKALAERLSMVDPVEFDDLEDLRQEVVEIVDQRLDESDFIPWARADEQFHFLQSKTILLATGRVLTTPEQLPAVLPHLSTGSIFYHFIDARRRAPDSDDDFNRWLRDWGPVYEPLVASFASVDPYFTSLERTREILADLAFGFFGAHT
jgi:hypothetical protein